MLKHATTQLTERSDTPKLDAELLLAHCLQKDRSYCYAWGEKQVNQAVLKAFKRLLDRRLSDYPLAYLIGYQGFWSLDLKVSEAVLIPRPETERLVDIALEKIITILSPKILDLGTGSGAIALALASERPDAQIIASDASNAALIIAKENATCHHIGTVQFIQSDWFNQIEPQGFDLIVTNPPYIESQDPHLEQSIRYEPLEALVSGETGLDDIQRILKQALDYMNKGAWILIEHGYNQGKQVPQLMQNIGLQQISCIKDANNNDRLSAGKKG